MRLVARADVARLLPMDTCIELMEAALVGLARGEAQVPLRSIVRLPNGPNVLAFMPAHADAPPALGAKVLTVFPENHARGLEGHQGAVLAFHPDDGRLLGLVDASSVTAIRTAAVSAVATRHLARADAGTLALLGSGVQARSHLEALMRVRPLRALRVWSRTPAHATAFAEWAATTTPLAATAVASAAEAVREADVVCTVTSSREPVLRGEWLAPGAHVNAVGASQPDARELDDAALARARLFTDRRASLTHESAAYRHALEAGAIDDRPVPELGEVAAGTAAGRLAPEEITVFKSLGLAIEDLVAASHVLRQAEVEGAGVTIDLTGA